MIFVDLDESLTDYAVLLNRPQWLSEERFSAQRRAWVRLAADETGDEAITVRDVDLAITTAIRLGVPFGEIVPSKVVEDAASLARGRGRRITQMILTDPVLWLSPARQRIQRAIDAEEHPAGIIAAVRDEIRNDLVEGQVAEDVMNRILDAVDAVLVAVPPMITP